MNLPSLAAFSSIKVKLGLFTLYTCIITVLLSWFFVDSLNAQKIHLHNMLHVEVKKEEDLSSLLSVLSSNHINFFDILYQADQELADEERLYEIGRTNTESIHNTAELLNKTLSRHEFTDNENSTVINLREQFATYKDITLSATTMITVELSLAKKFMIKSGKSYQNLSKSFTHLISTVSSNNKAYSDTKTTKNQQVKNYFLLLTTIFVSSVLASAYYLFNSIVKPITSLRKTTARVSQNKNYAVRAKKYNNDEIGKLVVDFNTMLNEIQTRDQELEQNELILRDSSELFSSTINTSVNAIITINASGIISMVNPACLTMFGYSEQQLLGANINLLMAPHEAVRHNKYLKNYLTSHEAKIIGIGRELTAAKKDNTIFQIHLSIGEMFLGTEKSPHFVATIQDISEQKKMQNGLIESKKIAEYANLAKSQFLATISHELRTPLTSIIGYSEAIKHAASSGQTSETTQEKTQEKTRKYSSIIERSSKHLLEIINEILDFSKVESGNITVEPMKFNLFHLTSEIESIFAPNFDSPERNFTVGYNFPIPEKIISDPLRVKQILLNLCSNATKFTKKGEVDLNISFDEQNNQIIFKVSDQGVGIAADKLDSIFEPFIQADNTTTREFGGTGLGLSITKKLVTLLGGEVEVSSVYGKGSIFKASIDCGNYDSLALVNQLSDIKQKMQENTTNNSPMEKLSGHVVLAEDWPDNQELIALYLDELGLSYDIVADGAQAIDKVKEVKPDLVLMDIQMPIMGGVEATDKLRNQGNEIPIIAITANVLKGDVDTYLAAGFTAVLAKPIDKTKFYQVLSQYVSVTKVLSENTTKPDNNQAVSKTKLSKSAKFQKLVDNFVARLPETMTTLLEHAQQNNWASLGQTIHILKGSGGQFGQPKITEICTEIDILVKQDSYNAVKTHLHRLQTEINRITID